MTLERLYLGTMIALIIHQIDAAYWKEWEMFYLPGGVQGYLLFNILVIPVVLFGYKQIILNTRSAKYYSYICGGLGVLTFFLHSGLAAFGAEQFNLPLSVVIIALCLMLGSWQIVKTKQATWD